MATDHLEKSIQYNSTVDKYRILLDEVGQAIKKAEEVRKQAFELSRNDKWDDAAKTMEMALNQYRSMPQGNSDLENIKQGAYRYHVKQGQHFLQAGDLNLAEAEGKLALSYGQQDTEADGLLTEVANRRKAEELVQLSENFIKDGRCEDALKALEEAQTLHPSRSDLPPLILTAKKLVCDKTIKQGQECMNGKDYCEALRLFRQSKTLLSDYGDIDVLIENVCTCLAESHFKSAKHFSESGLPGNALLESVLVLGYTPNNSGAQEELLSCITKIQQQTKYCIGFVGFKPSARTEETANTLESAALQHLNRVKPPNVFLLDRIDLKKVVEEQNLNLTDIVDPNFRIDSGQAQGC